MAIEIKYAINMALQYNNANEFNIEDYLLADNETGKLFLTESPSKRVLNEAEKSALYFLIDDDLFNASVYYEMYNSSGDKIDEGIAEMGYNHLIHNSIPVNTTVTYVDPETKRLDVSIISNVELIVNGDFSAGVGDTFTGWTKVEGNGTIVENLTGGVSGSRAVQLNRNTDFQSINQVVFPSVGTYSVSFWAYSLNTSSGAVQPTSDISIYPTINITDVLTRYEFIAIVGVGDSEIILGNVSPDGTQIIIDRVQVRLQDISYLTEIKSYEIDRQCYDYNFQINWLNKLGGRDTFMFTAKPNIETTVERNNLIELSKLSNFESPKRIYGYREHISRKTYNLVHLCKDRSTADWLKRELIDSIDAMMVINDYYYPVLVITSSIEENKFSANYQVNLQFRLAFDNNIQTR